MCLELKKSDRIKFTWFKPIVVYKLLYRSSKNELITIYRDKKVKIGRRYFSRLCRFDYYSINESNIGKGLHSFVNIEDAEKMKSGNQILVKCVIPRFTWYYRGYFENYKSIASSSLKYLKIIE